MRCVRVRGVSGCVCQEPEFRETNLVVGNVALAVKGNVKVDAVYVVRRFRNPDGSDEIRVLLLSHGNKGDRPHDYALSLEVDILDGELVRERDGHGCN